MLPWARQSSASFRKAFVPGLGHVGLGVEGFGLIGFSGITVIAAKGGVQGSLEVLAC